jgi:hypothetical protein
MMAYCQASRPSLDAPGVPAVVLDANGRKVFDAFTPTASIALHASQGLLGLLRLDNPTGHFSYGRGFKGGGFNQIAFLTREDSDALDTFDPEFRDALSLLPSPSNLRRRSHLPLLRRTRNLNRRTRRHWLRRR